MRGAPPPPAPPRLGGFAPPKTPDACKWKGSVHMVHKGLLAAVSPSGMTVGAVAPSPSAIILAEGSGLDGSIPEIPAPLLSAELRHDNILWRDGRYSILKGGQPVLLPFIETNPATGVVT